MVPVRPATRRRIRSRALRYAATFTAPLLALAAFTWGGLWSWTLPVYAFMMIPLIELFLPTGHIAISEEEERAALEDPLFDLMLYAVVPVQWALLLLFLMTIDDPGIPGWEVAGRISSMGLLCGIYGINVAHELGHRARRWERGLARALLLTSLYMHFIIEHNRGHHRRVATADDPASARYGETVFAFWARSIVYSFLSAWHIEADRLRKSGGSSYGAGNEMIHAILWQGALLAVITLVWGPFTLLAFVAAAVIGILLLETVNYIEHYGLRRSRTPGGGHVRVMHHHSWNSDHLLGRLMLFELSRHSDHHWKASRKYQVLRSHAGAPQMPTGYPGMMVLCLVPPLFFRVMHPRLHKLAADHAHLELAA